MKKTKYLLMFLLLVAGLTLVGCKKTTTKVTTKNPTTSQTTASQTTSKSTSQTTASQTTSKSTSQTTASQTTSKPTTKPTTSPTTAPTTAPTTTENADLAAAEKAANAAIAGIANAENVTADFKVVAENTKSGVTFVWSSNNEAVAKVSEEAVDKFYTISITQPEGTGDVRVILTLVATCGEESVTKTTTITVKEKVLGTKYDSIAKLYASAKLKDVVVITGTVSSLFKGGYFIYDGVNYLGIYENKDLPEGIEIGKSVTVVGSYANYNTLYQISDIVNTIIHGDSEIALPEAQPITSEQILAITGEKTDHGIPHIVTATIREIVEGTNKNYDLYDGETRVGRIYYNSLASSYDVIKTLVGKTVTLELVFYTVHSSNGRLFTFSGTADDVIELDLTDAEKLENEKAALTLVSELESEKTLTLPAALTNGVTVTWLLKDGSLGTLTGFDYKAPKVEMGQPDVEVVFIATLALNGLTDTKEIIVKVTPKKVFEVKTVAEMLALPVNDKAYFQVTGIVKAYSGKEDSAKKYGNIILQDPFNPEVTIIVYGIGVEGAPSTQNVLGTKGVNIGDMITVIGYRGAYGDTPEILGGWYVTHAAVKNIADIDSLEAGDTYYAFYGTISDYNKKATQTEIDNSIKYGNYYLADLVDATKTYLVYGILLEKGGKSGNAASLGLELGDQIVIIGQISVYKEVKQIANAYYIAHVTPEVTDPDQEAVNADKEALTLPASGNFNAEIELPALGEHGTTISWVLKEGSKGSIADGKLVLPAEAVTVTVVATITKGEISDTKEFEVAAIGEAITVAAARALDLGTVALVEGVVSVKNADGFFIQDNDGTTIFVYNKNNTVVVGNKVKVLGTVAKYISNGNDLLQLSPGNVTANDNGANAVVENTTITTIEAAVAAYPNAAGHIITLHDVVVAADTFGYLYFVAVTNGVDLKFKPDTVSATFVNECPAGSTIGTVKFAMYNINYSDIVVVIIEAKDIVKPVVEIPDAEEVTITFPNEKVGYTSVATDYVEAGITLSYLQGQIAAPDAYKENGNYAMTLGFNKDLTEEKTAILTISKSNLKSVSFDWFVWYATNKDKLDSITTFKVEVFDGETLVKSIDLLSAAKDSARGQVTNQKIDFEVAGDYRIVWTVVGASGLKKSSRLCIDNITLKFEK